jgi:hypothetical protein
MLLAKNNERAYHGPGHALSKSGTEARGIWRPMRRNAMMRKKTIRRWHIGAFILMLLICLPASLYAQWTFDWEVRTDRDGREAGIFATTPFPITEASTTYAVRNDENPNGKTFTLGTKYYVDGGYTGGGSNGSWARPWTTIAAALDNVGSGNRTIIVRGAHDSFDGIYTEFNLGVPSGTDDTHRYMICGYGQERPEINGRCPNAKPVQDTLYPAGDGRYVTFQRLKVSNNYGRGIIASFSDSFVNTIDVHLYNCAAWSTAGVSGDHVLSDGNLYYMGADDCWIYHCTSEYSYGHGFKVGDGAHRAIVEWSVANNCGYWPTMEPEAFTWYGSHATCFDFPADGTAESPNQQNITVRYNKGWDSLFYTLQIRRCSNFSVHHNDFASGPHWDDVADASSHGLGETPAVALIFSIGCYGKFYSNVIHDGSDHNSQGVAVTSLDSPESLLVYDNLIYGCVQGIAVRKSTASDEYHVYVLNNSIYASSSDTCVFTSTGMDTDDCQITNNILYQAGSGECIRNARVHTYNLLYAPGGSYGVTRHSTEITGNPMWAAIPSGSYMPTFALLNGDSPAVGRAQPQDSRFIEDMFGTLRTGGWDIGAVQFGSGSSLTPSKLRMKGQP